MLPLAVVAMITQPNSGVEIGQETLLVISLAQVSFARETAWCNC